jgi:putative membrane-bound dehydrogenase-like protein
LKALSLLLTLGSALHGQVVPHNQDRPPGPALTPEQAIRTMTVPEGFRVEVFAAEPDIVNPTSMTFDERGRIWITESEEYPRKEAGPGRDRIKILEDTDGDGRADRFTVFAEGLNIPCGIALGYGGAFVTNSPDILFLKDTDGDGKADRREVVLTGFGRHDTHELPNNLTWGPDGWLYGLNGVFNTAQVTVKGREHRFDAALWRYHPRTRDFELFAEGTSNPWGLAFDQNGSAFVSACVIDHLFHLAEGGYYHRQAGQYPPFTWKIESIVHHTHQKAAYCGLALYDADLYPERYRDRLFMGNIHGNCINVDRLERQGSTYRGEGEPDFLSGNDVWFMPVSVKLGPDGCFYVLDWYDRYHCYQDANRDPAGIDRSKGRLYRIGYGKAGRREKFDLASLSSERLLERLGDPNLWWRSEARRLLVERLAGARERELVKRLEALALDPDAARKAALQALWTLVGAEDPGSEPRFLDPAFHLKLLSHPDGVFRAWGVRAAGNLVKVSSEVRERIAGMVEDPAAEVRLQVATFARKLYPGKRSVAALLSVLKQSEGDLLIPHLVWRNLEPLLDSEGTEAARWLESQSRGSLAALEPLLGRMVERLMARKEPDLGLLSAILDPVLSERKVSPRAAADSVGALSRALEENGAGEELLGRLRGRLSRPVGEVLAEGRSGALYFPALSLAAAWRDPRAIEEARAILLDAAAPAGWRALSLEALSASRDRSILDAARAVLSGPSAENGELVRQLLAALGRLDLPEVAAAVLTALDRLPPSLRPQAIDLLTERPAWASALLDAVEAKRVERSTLNVNQVRRILALGDERLRARTEAVWGTLRAERSPEREKVIARMKTVLEMRPGNPWSGKAVFEKTCLQCHVIFGKGNAVGPDLTQNGRETVDGLLSNLLDPNLVIGKGYHAWTLATRSGRLLSGLLVEDSQERVVLKVAGGKEEVIARGDVRSLERSEVSLMPEDLEKTLKEEEFRDLIAYLRYEEPPPEPVPVRREGAVAGSERRIRVEEEYGELRVSARFPEGGRPAAPGELLRYHHSSDGRPFLHPLRAPGGGPVLTAARSEDGAAGGGLFTAHPRANGIDLWGEKGWIRSRGLESVRELPDRVEIVSRSDWLTARRGGRRLALERQLLTVHAPQGPALYRIDLEWQLIPDEELTLGEDEKGGLALRFAPHKSRRVASGERGAGRGWQDLTGSFGLEGRAVEAGVAILDHPRNPGFPALFKVDGRGLLTSAVSGRGPLKLPAGKPAVFRYRLLVHQGAVDPRSLDEEFHGWAESGSP